MYCNKCGSVVNGLYCSNCGAKCEGITLQSDSISKFALRIYLSDVLAAEYAIDKLMKKRSLVKKSIDNILGKVDSLKQSISSDQKIRAITSGPSLPYIAKPKMPSKPRKHNDNYEYRALAEKAEESKSLTKFILPGIVLYICTFMTGAMGSESGMNCESAVTIGVIIGLILGSIIYYYTALKHILAFKEEEKSVDLEYENAVKRYSKEMAAYDLAIKRYETQKREAEKEYSRQYEKAKSDAVAEVEQKIMTLEQERQEVIRKNSGLGEMIEEAERIRNVVYSPNIIPSKFRSLSAIYFLWDFITTSQMDLQSALLHCDLDKIQKLQTKAIITQQEILLTNYMMIAQNNRLITGQNQLGESLGQINQSVEELKAQANVNNDTLIKHSKEILEYERKNAENTAVAAEYGRIAAVNSEVLTFFAAYDVLK